MEEFKRLMVHSRESVRREIAMAMLREGNQEGEAEVLRLLEDKDAVSWKRENAAFALGNATSAQARQALERAANQPGSDELRHAAQESLSRMNH
jgi:HEAT repeat protein